MVKSRLMETEEENKDNFCRWIDGEVMEKIIYEIMETEVFEGPRALNEITDIIANMCSYLQKLSKEDIENEIDYILDMPCQIGEMIKESSNVPSYYSYSSRQEDEWGSERKSIIVSQSNISFTYELSRKE